MSNHGWSGLNALLLLFYGGFDVLILKIKNYFNIFLNKKL